MSTAGFLVPVLYWVLALVVPGIAALGGAATGVEKLKTMKVLYVLRGTIDPTKQGQALFAGILPGTIEAVPSCQDAW